MKALCKIFNLFFMLIGINALGQTDTLPTIIKRDLLDLNNIKEWKDTSGIKVISASRSAKNIDDLPVIIYVISHEEIQRNHFTTLADILKYLPGIRVSQPGSGEAGEIFQFRGLIGNYYTKILINNLPVKPTVVNGMPLGAQLPIRQAERIEIIYGPAAAVYGADAVTGVINIITKEAEKGTFVRSDISLGEYEYNYINFTVGGKALKNKNILHYSFYGSKSEFNNMNIKQYKDVYNPLYYLQKTGNAITLNGIEYQPIDITEELLQSHGITEEEFKNQYYNPYYEGGVVKPSLEEIPSSSHMIGFELKWRGFSIAYNKMSRRTHSSLGRSTYLFKYNNPQNYWGENIQRYVISYDRKWENFSSSSHLSYLSYKMDNNSNYGVTFLSNTDKAYIYSASDDVLAAQILTYTPSSNFEIVSGASFQLSGNLPLTSYQTNPFTSADYDLFSEEKFNQDPLFGEFGINPTNFYNISSFIQFYYVRKKITFMGGLRYDLNSQYGDNFNPRIAALYKWGERTTLIGSYGRAYMAPSTSMSYQSLAYSGGINNDSIYYMAIPNTDLEPEKFQAYEFGIKRRFFRNIYTNISLFYNQIENLIVDTYVPIDDLNLPRAILNSDTTMARKKVNSSDAKSTLWGAQANIKFKDIVSSVKLNVELNFTYTETTKSLSEIGSVIGDFELMPNHIGQLRISFQPTERLYVQFDNVWMSKWLRVLIPIEEIYPDPYESVDGYYTLDALLNLNLSDKLRFFIKYINVFDEQYGGINVTGTDLDLPSNPQLGQCFKIGLNYRFN